MYRLKMAPWAETCSGIVRPINSIMHSEMWVNWYIVVFDRKMKLIYSTNTQQFAFLKDCIQHNYCVSGHYPLSCFHLRHTMFRRLDSFSIFRWNLLSYTQLIELIPISGCLHQHKREYINQAQHKPSARVKTDIKSIKKTPHTWGLAPTCYVSDTVQSPEHCVFYMKAGG
jgi:hypothetical protein